MGEIEKIFTEILIIPFFMAIKSKEQVKRVTSYKTTNNAEIFPELNGEFVTAKTSYERIIWHKMVTFYPI